MPTQSLRKIEVVIFSPDEQFILLVALMSAQVIWKERNSVVARDAEYLLRPYVINSYSASQEIWCTATLWNRIMTAQCEGMGGSRVGEVRAGTTSPMPEHKGFKLQ